MTISQTISKGHVELGVRSNLKKGLNEAKFTLQRFGNDMQKIGRQMTFAGLAAATPFALSMKQFATYEQAMARVRALTGATGSDFQRLQDKVREMGETTSFTAQQAAQAMGVFALAGNDVDTILSAMKPTLDMAAAGMIDAGLAADMANKVIKSMGLRTSGEISHAMDVMTKAFTTANLDLVQMADAFKYFGPVARSAGLSIEEASAAIQVLADAGIQGDIAGTSLRGMMMSLTNPAKDAEEAMQILGVSVRDVNDNMRPFGNIIADMHDGIKLLGSASQLEMIGRIFPNRQAAAAFKLVSEGADQYLNRVHRLIKSEGEAARIRDIQLSTTQGAWIILKSVVESTMISIGNAINGPLKGAVIGLTEFTKSARVWVDTHHGAILKIAAAIAAVIGVGGALWAGGMVLSMISTIVVGAVTAFTSLITVITSVGSALLAMATVAGGLPLIFTGIVAGIGAIAAAMWMDSHNVWGQAKSALHGIGNVVSDTVGSVVKALTNGEIELAGKIAFTGLKMAIVEVLEGIAVIFDTTIDKLLEDMGDKLEQGIRQKKIWERLPAAMKDAAGDTARIFTSWDMWGTASKARAENIKLGNMERDRIEKDIAKMDLSGTVKGVIKALDPGHLKADMAELNNELAKIEARRKREQEERDKRPDPGPTPDFGYVPGELDLPELPDIDELKNTLDTVKQTITTTIGSFSASVLQRQRLSSVKHEQKIEKSLEDVVFEAKQTNMYLDNLISLNPVFH